MERFWMVSLAVLFGCAGEPPVLQAQSWNADEGCWEALATLEDEHPGGPCDDTPTVVNVHESSCYLFPDNCYPEVDVWGPGCPDEDATADAPTCGE